MDFISRAAIVVGLSLAWIRLSAKGLKFEIGLLAWIGIPLAIALIVSVVSRPVYSPRNMLVGFGAALLVLARSIVHAGYFMRRGACGPCRRARGVLLRDPFQFWQRLSVPAHKAAASQRSAAFLDRSNDDCTSHLCARIGTSTTSFTTFRGTDDIGRLRRIEEPDVLSPRPVAVVPGAGVLDCVDGHRHQPARISKQPDSRFWTRDEFMFSTRYPR